MSRLFFFAFHEPKRADAPIFRRARHNIEKFYSPFQTSGYSPYKYHHMYVFLFCPPH